MGKMLDTGWLIRYWIYSHGFSSLRSVIESRKTRRSAKDAKVYGDIFSFYPKFMLSAIAYPLCLNTIKGFKDGQDFFCLNFDLPDSCDSCDLCDLCDF